MRKTSEGSRTIAASAGLLVEAQNEKARAFYKKYEFISPFPDTPNRLFLRIETIAKLLDKLFPSHHHPV
jgi:hypothetical protein